MRPRPTPAPYGAFPCTTGILGAVSIVGADLSLATGETRVVRRARRSGRRAGQGTADEEPAAQAAAPTGPVLAKPRQRRSLRDVLDDVVVAPEIRGPRVRVGILWFLLALAAVTTSRMWTAALVTVVAAAAAYQSVRAWRKATYVLPEPDESGRRPIVPPGTGRAEAIIAVLAVAVPLLAAGFSTGAAGLMLMAIAALVVAVRFLASPSLAGIAAIGIFPPVIAAMSIVLAVQASQWAGIYLVVAVSLYDAGNFLLGSEASKRWEGPVAGMIGALAVTFTVATIGLEPLGRVQWWLAGVLVALCCPLGQWLVTALMPDNGTWVPALRRLDAYLLAGPVFVVMCWVVGS